MWYNEAKEGETVQYILMDMEWNQAMSKERIVTSPVRLTGEIVQIGAVRLDENFRRTDTFKVTVRPKYYKKMHWKVQKITGITEADLANGLPFPEALDAFLSWCGDDFVFLTWGFDDTPMLRDNMRLYALDASRLPVTYNVQLMFNAQLTHENNQCGLSKAMELVGEPELLTAHDALHDAMNTYLVSTHLDMKKGIREYPKEAFSRGTPKPKRPRRRKVPVTT